MNTGVNYDRGTPVCERCKVQAVPEYLQIVIVEQLVYPRVNYFLILHISFRICV